MTRAIATQPRKPIAWGRYLLLLGIGAWMFILGILVGRGTAPVKFDIPAIQEEIAALRESMIKKERDEILADLKEGEKNFPGFYEDLKKNGPDTTVGGTRVQPRAEREQITRSPHKTRATLMAKKKMAIKLPSPASASGMAAIKGGLTIQLEALKDRKTAQQNVAKLKKAGYPAYLSTYTDAKKRRWFRVRVGHYKNKKQAATDLRRLTRDHKKIILVPAEAN